MLSRQQREQIENATIRVGGGSGILLANGIILTARHCVPSLRSYSGKKPETVEEFCYGVTCDGVPIDLAVRYHDPRADLAILTPDPGSRGDDTAVFISRAHGVPLRSTHIPEKGLPGVWLRHPGGWFGGRLTLDLPAGKIGQGLMELFDGVGFFMLNADMPLRPGMSGSPIVDSSGALIGCVTRGNKDGSGPVIHAPTVLPGWARREMAPK